MRLSGRPVLFNPAVHDSKGLTQSHVKRKPKTEAHDTEDPENPFHHQPPKQTRHAFSYAVGLASQYGASLTILYVMEEFSPTQSANLQGFIGDVRWEDTASNPTSRRCGRSWSARKRKAA